MSTKTDNLKSLLDNELSHLKMKTKLQTTLVNQLRHAKRMIVILSQSCGELKSAIYDAQSAGDGKNHSFFAKLHNSAIADIHMYSDIILHCKQRLKFWDKQFQDSKLKISALEESIKSNQ